MGISDILQKIKKEWEVLKGQDSKDKLFMNEHTYPDEATAQREFARARQKLFDVNAWSHLPGITSTFQLFNSAGTKSQAQQPAVGDFIEIILPGTPVENWVTVTGVLDEEDVAQFVVKPSQSPEGQADPQDSEVKHFFSPEASSTFRVLRDGNTLMGFEIGKDEVINNSGPEAGGRAVLNTLISEGGWAGFQDLQWDKITKYFVHLEETKQ
ncbi:hypothetical protein TH63_04435 [Rufibacter radiotolerans]|uniref:Uncharacterized protein n=1 Tax=Rufibacter radiotolerans TaxID=1379910 RepID=A0A0H4VH86_9BACT|nr:hypothetical protein [Rufibacter radiotolerans]AKQ45050.1 hypothetical protein TH63_04435 [Rufibacter radiotolerans]